ncbi:MAG TPA: N-acetylmuramoyl-L-alanine amidase [Streptosporangiaceae bacterium]
MSTVPGRLHIRSDGRVAGPASIEYNDPFPCVNGSWGSGAMKGVVMHTMVGNLPGTIQVFNQSSYQASAHFGIDQQGHIHQFGPIGRGWIAWAQVAGNDAWYSIEHADNGDTHNPLTDAQITASAQLVEVLSRFAGFPLQVTDSVDGRGYGVHCMGGEAWGGHTCPGPGPRAGQREAIIDLAKQIRHQHGTPSATWQAKAYAQATALGAELTALVALLQPGDALTKAKAIQADASELADLIKQHQ